MSVAATASAPGKLILFGEHSEAQHWRQQPQPVVCASLSDVHVNVRVESRSDGNFAVDMPDVLFDHSPGGEASSFPSGPLRYQGRALDLLISPLGDLEQVKHLQHEGGRLPPSPFRPNRVDGDHADNYEAINPLSVVRNQIMGVLKQTGITSEVGLRALAQVVFLANELVPLLLSENYGISIAVVSGELPIGAGLGSSAAFTSAMSAALFKLHNLLHMQEPADTTSALTSASPSPRVRQGQWLGVPPTTALDIIHRHALLAESIASDNDTPHPSGINDVDATISCYGGAVWSQKEDAGVGGRVLTEPLVNFPQFDVLLTNTGVPRSAEKLEARVDDFAADFPEVAQGIFDAIGGISRQFRAMGATVTESPTLAPYNYVPLDHYDVSRLVRTNQHLLRALGVSNPTLDKICSITDRYNAVTFLTGAGGGGYAVTFLGNTSSSVPEEQKSIRCAVETSSNNFQCVVSSVGGPGVLWTEELPLYSESNSSDVGSATQRQLDGEEEVARKQVMSTESTTLLAVAATVSAVGACIASRMLTHK